jgi:hypothetical protein
MARLTLRMSSDGNTELSCSTIALGAGSFWIEKIRLADELGKGQAADK